MKRPWEHRSGVCMALALLALLWALALAACGGSSTAASNSPSVAPSAVTTASPQSTTAVTGFHGMLPIVFTQSLVRDSPLQEHRDGRRRHADAPRPVDLPATRVPTRV